MALTNTESLACVIRVNFLREQTLGCRLYQLGNYSLRNFWLRYKMLVKHAYHQNKLTTHFIYDCFCIFVYLFACLSISVFLTCFTFNHFLFHFGTQINDGERRHPISMCCIKNRSKRYSFDSRT